MTRRKTEKVSQHHKEDLVRNIFSTVSSRYDLMNDIMSFGIHRLWKDAFIKKIPEYSAKLLDVAGGTGDITLKYYREALAHNGKPDITLLDLNSDMLKQAQDNFINHNIINKIKFVCGNALALPFPDNCFDYYTIAYGIRNVSDIERALMEAWRVLKKGGKFLCLEFSHVENDMFQKFYDLYSESFIPFIGGKITGSRDSYQYLVDSIRAFPRQQEFCRLIEKAGFKAVHYDNLSFGISAIHWGYKL